MQFQLEQDIRLQPGKKFHRLLVPLTYFRIEVVLCTANNGYEVLSRSLITSCKQRIECSRANTISLYLMLLDGSEKHGLVKFARTVW